MDADPIAHITRLLDPLLPLDEDAGAQTLDRYHWQAKTAAARIFEELHQGIAAKQRRARSPRWWIVCEIGEDWIFFRETPAGGPSHGEFVSAKHHDPGTRPWSFRDFVTDGGIAHLYRSWWRTGRSFRCRLVTNHRPHDRKARDLLRVAELVGPDGNVPPEHAELVAEVVTALERALRHACQGTAFHGPGPLPDRDPWPEGAAQFRKTVQAFVSALSFECEFPERTFVDDVAPNRYVGRLLPRSDLSREEIWQAVVHLVATKMAGSARTPLPELWFHDDLQGGNRSNRRTVTRRTIVPEEVHELLRRMAPRPTSPRAPHAPRQLPAAVPRLLGRREHLARLDEGAHPTSPQRLAVITGPAGVGKTALAIAWANRAQHRFPDGQLFLDMQGYAPDHAPLTAKLAVEYVLHALQPEINALPPTESARLGRYRDLMATRRVLLVLDNAIDLDHVRPLLGVTDGSFVVVTSRHQSGGCMSQNIAADIALRPLPANAARTLLAEYVPAARLDAEPQAARRLIAFCGGLPLAIGILGARLCRLPNTPLSAIADGIAEASDRLDFLTAGSPRDSIRGVFSWSYAALEADGQRAFRLIATAPGPDIDAEAAAVLLGTRVGTILAPLVQMNLLEEPTFNRFRMHDLVRAYAIDMCRDDETFRQEAAVAANRLIDHYIRCTEEAGDWLNRPRGEEPGALASDEDTVFQNGAVATRWLADRLPVLLDTVGRTYQLGRHTALYRLVDALVIYLWRQGHWADCERVLTTALDSAQRHGDASGQARLHDLLSNTYRHMGRFDASVRHAEAVLRVPGRQPTLEERAVGHYALAMARSYAADDTEDAGKADRSHCAAIAAYRTALDAYRGMRDRSGEAHVLNGLGWSLARTGQHGDALHHCREALAIHRELREQNGEAAALDTLGEIHRGSGNLAEAVRCYRDCLAIYRKLEYPPNEARTLETIGDIHSESGDQDSALQAWIESADILTRIHHPGAVNIQKKIAKAGLR
ncbi:tetratricopeptide repeat protein [Marinactinospora rubrisoli]|uniref:Tetratricopeptide repeat protein n=1 Tax=Marinactinospora rubrisoli TaxID=2715399 RepID=A0ABW2KHX3_9ACTN